jgi:hypothetical protein
MCEAVWAKPGREAILMDRPKTKEAWRPLRNNNNHQPYCDEHLYVDLQHGLVKLDAAVLTLTPEGILISVSVSYEAHGTTGPRQPATSSYRGFAFVPQSFVPAQRGEMAVPLKSPSLDQPFYRDEHLFVNLRQQLVLLDGQTLRLSHQEHSLLALFVQHAGEIVPRAILLT